MTVGVVGESTPEVAEEVAESSADVDAVDAFVSGVEDSTEVTAEAKGKAAIASAEVTTGAEVVAEAEAVIESTEVEDDAASGEESAAPLLSISALASERMYE